MHFLKKNYLCLKIKFCSVNTEQRIIEKTKNTKLLKGNIYVNNTI